MMGPVPRWLLLWGMLSLALTACSLAPERQWYKPGANYTVADFERDQAACTTNRQLDEECLKQKGWVPLSGEATKRQQTIEEQERERHGGRTGTGRY